MEQMTPIEDFENQLLLSSFGLASHSLRLLGKAGMLDDPALFVIRNHLQMLQEKIDAMPDEAHRDFFHDLDALTAVLPPATRGGGSPASE